MRQFRKTQRKTEMEKLISIIRKLIIYTWLILTIVVVFFLISRIANPETKGISNYDLKFYFEITIYFCLIYIVLKIIQNRIKQ